MTLTVLTFSTPCNCYIILPYSACRQELTNYYLRINVFDTDQCVAFPENESLYLVFACLRCLFRLCRWHFVRVSTGNRVAHDRKISSTRIGSNELARLHNTLDLPEVAKPQQPEANFGSESVEIIIGLD